ncbi:MAG: hypothetical protein M3R61_21475, partial [Chloroflexota bacterium]|nr:hypothetical protein [Chloroflexota bacterium]
AAPTAAPTVQRAALSRSSPGRLSPPSAPAAPHQASATPPALDLDALAQQIYARIRQRLADERRRMG